MGEKFVMSILLMVQICKDQISENLLNFKSVK
jgi:hypothetical protein